MLMSEARSALSAAVKRKGAMNSSGVLKAEGKRAYAFESTSNALAAYVRWRMRGRSLCDAVWEDVSEFRFPVSRRNTWRQRVKSNANGIASLPANKTR